MKTPIHTNLFEMLESRTMLSAGTGLTGEYFVGDNFQTPKVVRADARINFNYQSGRPDQDVPAGVFTTRWTGFIQPITTGIYTFYTNANSGTRVTVNGTTIIDNFTNRTSVVSQGAIALTAGQQTSIQVEYVSRGNGTAKMQLLWSTNGIAKQIVPKSALYPDATVALPTAPLLGTYFLGGDFQTQVMTRADTKVRFNWDTGSPDPTIPRQTPFSVRWTGNITAPTTGVYRFQSITDDGVRLFVNGTEIINDWHVHSAQSDYGKITLQAGQTYSIRMEYFQNGAGHTSAKLLWKIPGQNTSEKFVPFSAAASATAPVTPPNVTATAVSTSQIHVAWDDVTGETGFNVLRSDDGGLTFHQVGTTAQGVTTFDDTGLTTNTAYQYEIIATNAAGNSAPSVPALATTLGLQPTAVVASATASGTIATITWTASPTATSYLVERSPDGSTGWTSVGTTANTSLQDNNLSAATTYFYRVTPSNAQGPGPVSNVVSITTVPDAPIGLTATTASDTQINLAWNDVTGETGFIVQRSPDGSTGWTQIGTTAAGSTTFPASGLSPSTQYFFRVIAIDAGGDSLPSNVANATTNAASPAYANLTALYGLTTNAKVYSIDTTNGNATQIGSLSFGTNAGGRDPVSGDFFYVSTASGTVAISAWHPANDTNRVVNPGINVGYSVAQAAFRDDGQFFLATGQGDLYSINATTGAGTLRGNIHLGSSTLLLNTGDLAFGPDGTLFIETNSELYSASRAAVDAATGSGSIITVTDLGPTGTANLQIAFGQNGTLFGQVNTGELYSVNTTNGAATLIGAGNGLGMNDLASTPLYADLSFTQTASAFAHGGNGAYTLTINNAGPNTTIGPMTLVDTLAAGLTFTSGSGTGWSFALSGQTVTATYTGTLATGASAPPITLNVGVGTSAANNVTNAVSVNANVFDTNTSNNIGTLSSVVTG